MRSRRPVVAPVAALVLAASPLAASPLAAQGGGARAGYTAEQCPSCAAWNAPRAPFRVHGETYYVGTRGLAAVLVTSDAGHVLIDGGLPESAPAIAASIRALGFRVEDVKLVVSSHAHYDHAGGIAELQRLSGATVAASPRSAPVLATGLVGPDDPQHAIALAFPAASGVRTIADGDTLRVGPLALVARFTPGHTPGGTTWTWRSCDDAGRCLDLVYADSQTPVSADGFSFTRTTTYPTVLRDFERGLATIEGLRCDVLLTPHPDASGLWQRVAARDRGERPTLAEVDACRRYAAAARERIARRVAEERERP